MKIETIGLAELKRSFGSALQYISLNAGILDNLNVFPVPDGDTGSNMLSTLEPAVGALLADGTDGAADCAGAWKTMSDQAGQHSRGNSGFILACFFRGFSDRLGGASGLTAELIRGGFGSGSYAARSSLLSPVEGTMITVIAAMAEAMAATESRDIGELLESALDRGRKAVFDTPRLLPVLARAGVVDAGGLGFVFLIEGMRRGLLGAEPRNEDEQEYRFAPDPEAEKAVDPSIRYRYCTELSVRTEEQPSWPEIKSFLMQHGGSIALLQEADCFKVHIHTNDPEGVRTRMAELGTIVASKIDDMAEQINAGIQGSGASGGSSVLAVIPGPGFRGVFRDLEASACLEYGEQLPSCGEILEALGGMGGRNVVVLPNDKNIIPAARLAQERSDKNVFVVPAANVVQGITALYGFNEEDSAEANFRSMRDSLDLAICLRVCRSDRDSRYGSVGINRGDAFVLHGEEVLAVDPCVITAVEQALSRLDLGDAGCISVYYGRGFDPSRAEELALRIRRLCDALEVELHDGGQTGSLLIVAVE